MRIFLASLVFLSALTASAQTVSRAELRATNNALLNAIAAVNGPTNGITATTATNIAAAQAQAAVDALQPTFDAKLSRTANGDLDMNEYSINDVTQFSASQGTFSGSLKLLYSATGRIPYVDDSGFLVASDYGPPDIGGIFSFINSNVVNVTAYGAVPDNSTDSTAAFRLALATGRPVYVPPAGTNRYIVSNLILSNNTLFSHGAVIGMKSGSTGFLISFAPYAYFPNYDGMSNVWQNNRLIGLTLEGSETSIPSSAGSRHGVWVDPYGKGNALEDCVVNGFSGAGVFISSHKPLAGVDPYLRIDQGVAQIRNVVVTTNYYGIYWQGGVITLPGIANTSDGYISEYLVTAQVSAQHNYIGGYSAAGNSSIVNCQFNRNTIGLYLHSGHNDGHGVVSGCIINHNSSRGILASNIVNGMQFLGCQMWFNDIYLTNSTGIVYENGVLSSGNFISGSVNGTNRNEVRNLKYNVKPSVTVNDRSRYYNWQRMDGVTDADSGFVMDRVRADDYYSGDGTQGATATTGGATFKDGLYTGGTISGGSGSQTPWTSDIDGGGYSLTNVGNISSSNLTFMTLSLSGAATFAGPVTNSGALYLTGLSGSGSHLTIDGDGNVTKTTISGSGGGPSVTNLSLYSGSSTNLVLDLGLASTNHVVFTVGMLTNTHLVFSNATSRKFPVEVIFQQDTNGNRSILSYSSTDGLIRTNGSLVLTTNANATDKWIVSADYFTTNVIVSAGESSSSGSSGPTTNAPPYTLAINGGLGSTNIVLDMAALGATNHVRATLTANAGLIVTNVIDGMAVTLELIQDSTGNRTVSTNATWGFNVRFGTDVTGFGQSTNANTKDLVRFLGSGTNALVIGSLRGFSL